MPWQGSQRRSRLPANWAEIRRQVLERDGHQCTAALPSGLRCPLPATDADHILPMTDDHSLAALQSLCSWHHRVKSASEGAASWAAVRRRMAAAKTRPQGKHPGLI